jgi:DDE_Tnp_1-associated
MAVAGGGTSLVERFAALRDPRQTAKVLYPLPEILLLLLCATLAGADDFVEVEVWGERNLAFLRRLLPFTHGIPSHDTLGDVVAMLDPGLFKEGFTPGSPGCAPRPPSWRGRR